MFGGIVIKGDGMGKKLGFPTANLAISISETGLAAGVYAAQAFLNQKKYRSALAIQEKLKKVEVHLLDYTGPDFYGEYVAVEPGEKVSEMCEVSSVEELRKKIAEDIKKILIISNSPNSPNF